MFTVNIKVMSVKLTTEEFIKRSKIIHQNWYTYELSIYKTNKTPIIITCPLHGNFEQTPDIHLRKAGCYHCGINKIKEKNLKSSDLWISQFNAVHNFKYKYPDEIKQGKEKINILCPNHGVFKQQAKSHLLGQGCPKCSAERLGNRLRLSDNEWRERFKIIHKDIYEYPNYIKGNEKIKIICKEHGEFYQRCYDHYKGHGCQKCVFEYNNFKKEDWIKRAKERQGVFYIIKCWNDEEEFFKFGITYNTTKKRYKAKMTMPYNYEIIREIKSHDLDYIWRLEKRFKYLKRKNRYVPSIAFKGYKTECFKL